MQNLQFERLGKDVNKIKEFIEISPISFCDISLGVKYMWREDFIIDYAILDDTLIMKESCPDYSDGFYFPIGKNVDGALKFIEEWCTENQKPLLFCCIDNPHAVMLTGRYPFSQVVNDRNWSDYIYDAEKFKTYSGKKYSGQRNHVNKFKRLYPDYQFKIIEESDFERIKEFLAEFELGNDFSAWTAKVEEQKVLDYLLNFNKIGQVGGQILVDGKVVAISLGEVVGNTLIVHVEKGLKNYEGVYPTMASEFSRAFAGNGVRFINREEDCGDMGLRISKLQYHPVDVKEKNLVKVKTLFDKINPPVLINTQRLTVTDIFGTDKMEYFRLYTDEKINEFYGYDYREDFSGETPTPEYFIEFMNGLKQKKEEYSLSVKKDGVMIGEIVLYGFDYFCGCEIGFRFFPKYHGNGYATESVTAVIDYLKDVGVKKIRCRAFKQNFKSLSLIERTGFIKVRESEEKFFFEKMI